MPQVAGQKVLICSDDAHLAAHLRQAEFPSLHALFVVVVAVAFSVVAVVVVVVSVLRKSCTKMQENTWARLRDSRRHQGASHAT